MGNGPATGQSAQMLITGHDSKIRQLTDVSQCNLQHHF